MKYKAIVIGVSSGGMNALKILLPQLPADFKLPVIIVQHLGARSDGTWITLLDNQCALHVKEADEKEKIEKGNIYTAPANYHLLVENNETFSLSSDEKVNYARPSIDVLFESAAIAYKSKLIGIILTGSNTDGTGGIKAIKENGGLTIAQDPESAESGYMPASAIATNRVDYVVPIEKIIDLLLSITK